MSAADVLGGQLPPGSVKDKIVFVGTTALGTREVVATPLDTLFAGVEVHATVADNLLQKDFIRRHAVGSALESQITLVLGVALSLIVARGDSCLERSPEPALLSRCGGELSGCYRPTAFSFLPCFRPPAWSWRSPL